MIDYCIIVFEDFVVVSLFYLKCDDGDDDDRGKEVWLFYEIFDLFEGYEVKGEIYGVLFNELYKLYYIKDMMFGEVMFIKCFDFWGDWLFGGKKGVVGLMLYMVFVDF